MTITLNAWDTVTVMGGREKVWVERKREREAIFHNIYLNMTYLHKDRVWKVNSAQVAQSLPAPNVFLGETEPAK